MKMRNELSRVKIAESTVEMNYEFEKWDVMRNLFETKYFPHFPIQIVDRDFVRIGYNHIILRDFFTDVKGATYYDNKGIGANYGKGIASGETKYILNILENKIDEEDYKQCEKSDVTSLIAALFYTYPDVRFGILANPTIISDFMNEEEILRKYTDTMWGLFNDRPLYWNPEISKNWVYLVDRDLGRLYVKQNITMEVQEIHSSEYDSILKDIDTLSIADLPNMVRVKANELIYFKQRDELRNGVIKITIPEKE